MMMMTMMTINDDYDDNIDYDIAVQTVTSVPR